MAIKARVTFNAADNLRNIEQVIIATLARRGESFVADARNNVNIDGAFEKGDYKDRTKNLRNSIGYFILKDNDVVLSAFPGGQSSEAKAALSEVPSRSGYRLIGMAGMSYAAEVESKGYNVITSQSFVTVELLRKDLNDLAKSTGKKMSVL